MVSMSPSGVRTTVLPASMTHHSSRDGVRSSDTVPGSWLMISAVLRLSCTTTSDHAASCPFLSRSCPNRVCRRLGIGRS